MECKIQGSQTLYEIISALNQSPIVYSMDVLELIDEESVQQTGVQKSTDAIVSE